MMGFVVRLSGLLATGVKGSSIAAAHDGTYRSFEGVPAKGLRLRKGSRRVRDFALNNLVGRSIAQLAIGFGDDQTFPVAKLAFL